jgi:hypothetical protein
MRHGDGDSLKGDFRGGACISKQLLIEFGERLWLYRLKEAEVSLQQERPADPSRV